MKYGKIIKPEDVPGMMRSGELRFGMKLEYAKSTNWDLFNEGEFLGFAPSAKAFCIEGKWYSRVRFIIPDLRDGDPVIVLDSFGRDWNRRFFSHFGDGSGIHIYKDGTNKWSCDFTEKTIHWGKWRLPTKKELREAGMENWFDGRDVVLEDE